MANGSSTLFHEHVYIYRPDSIPRGGAATSAWAQRYLVRTPQFYARRQVLNELAGESSCLAAGQRLLAHYLAAVLFMREFQD